MSERRALLDPDMYKISEEDSQDEEVLSSLSSKVTVSLSLTNEGNNNRPKTKPIPPVKPAFLRKNPTTNININNNLRQHTSTDEKSQKKNKSLYEKSGNGKASSSSIFHRTSGVGSSSVIKSQSQQSLQGTSDPIEWPSSSSTSSSSSGSCSENSGDVSSGDETRLTVMSGPAPDGPSRSTRTHSSYKEMKRKKKRVFNKNEGRNQSQTIKKTHHHSGRNIPNQNYAIRGGSETETGDEESASSTESGSQSCSSCDNHRGNRRKSSDPSGRYLPSDDNDSTGSYSTQYSSTDHPHSGESDMDFGDDDLYSDYLDDEDSLVLITETEIESWTTEDGSVLFCEYLSERSSSEISESVNEDAGAVPNRKSKQIHATSSVQGTPEIGSPSSVSVQEENPLNTKAEKGQNLYTGKISRLLKRGRVSKTREKPQQDSPQELESSSKSRLSSQSAKPQELKAKSKGNGSGAPEKVFRFKDEHEGEIRQVELTITSYSKHNLGRRATMVESLLGIIPSRFSSPSTASTPASISIGSQQQSSASVCDRPSSKSATAALPNKHSTKTESEDRRIMVAGFISDGPAARNRHIKIGDWLQRVNGVLVDFNNVNNVLLQIIQQDGGDGGLPDSPLKIRLELQRVSGYTVTEYPARTILGENKATNCNGWEPRSRETFLHLPKFSDPEIPPEIMSNIAVLYISVVNCPTSPLSKEKTKDVIFAWPKESESRKVKAMLASHGMFSTLYKLLRDVTGSNPISSRVMIDDEEMDIVFSSDDEGKGLLLLATAATLSNFNICQPHSSQLNGVIRESQKKEKKLRWKDPVIGGLVLPHRIMSRLENLLKYKFGSLSRAFRSITPDRLNHFLTQTLASLMDISEDFLFLEVPGNFLRIPTRIRCVIDERLYSFESSDSFSLCYGRRTEVTAPLFHCLGSCLYYKGMVVTSHLERNLTSHFHGWWRTQLGLWGVKRNTLPCFWEPVRRLVVWQETFQHLERNAIQEESLDSEVPSSTTTVLPCYSLLLGLGDYMLGLVLELAVPEQRVRTIDIGWIRRGLNCILRIQNSEIHASLESWIFEQENEFIELYPPRGGSAKTVLSGSGVSNVKKVLKQSPATGPASSILKNSEIPQTPSTPPGMSPGTSGLFSSSAVKTLISGQSNGGRNFPLGESGKASDSSYTESDTPINVQDYSYHYGLSVSGQAAAERPNIANSDDEDDIDENTTGTGSDTSSFKWYADEFEKLQDRSLEEGIRTVSITKGNVLFDFLQIEHGRGIILTSKDTLEGPFSVVIHNFRQSATFSHHILHKAANGRKRLSHQESDKKWVSKALTPISEHGILFNCDVVDPRDAHKKKPRLRQVSYWVIGRIYPNQREVYLCYQDSSVAQNLLEVAFKLAYYSM